MKKIYFYLASDTLIHLAEPVIKKLITKSNIKILIPKYFNENAESAIKKLLPNMTYKYFTIFTFLKDRPDVVVFGNDWSIEAKIIISLCRFFKITTYCIQESVIDFNDGTHKLEYADYIFIQGEQTQEHLKRENLILSGNPRYEDLKFHEVNKQQVLINCNFTYGIFEEVRNKWIADVVKVCKKNDVPFQISQHPRDKGDLSEYKEYIINSSADKIKNQITNSSIIITRFSSLIHEGILQGRKVIYYNPHNEKMFYDFKADEKILFLANNESELYKSLYDAKNSQVEKVYFEEYIKRHVRPYSKKPSEIIAESIIKDKKYKQSLKYINLKTISYYYSRTIIAFLIRKFK